MIKGSRGTVRLKARDLAPTPARRKKVSSIQVYANDPNMIKTDKEVGQKQITSRQKYVFMFTFSLAEEEIDKQKLLATCY